MPSVGARHPTNIANSMDDKFRLVPLNPVATLLRGAIFAARRTLREILSKLGPAAIPSRKLVLRHAVGLRVASISGGALERGTVSDHNQYDVRMPVKPLTRFYVPADSGHELVWYRAGGIDL